MTATSIQPPFEIFTDTNGQPLNNGYIYIGTANLNPETNPIAVYWDAALTVPALQPIRTIGGYPSRNGSAAVIYSGSGDYSITVRDSRSTIVFSSLVTTSRISADLVTVSDGVAGSLWTTVAGFVAKIISSAGSSVIGFIQSGAGAVATTVQSKLRESVSLEDFGAVGDGVTDDGPAAVLACNYCCTTGVTLRLKPKVYKNARIEVHGTYCVEGNGATVMYLGVGQTIIAGTGTGTAAVPSSWGTDPGYSPSYAPTTMYALTVAPILGATTLTLASASGIAKGMTLFIAGNPTSLSTNGNFIPKDFEFVTVVNVVGNVVTLSAPLQSSYLTTQSGLFYAPGLAINCHVSGLNINTTTDAYQQVVRSSIGCTIKDCTFSGKSAVGASTFSDGLVYENINVTGTTGGGFSTARGTVSTVFRNVNMKNCTSTNAFFLEESCYKVTLDNFFASGSFTAGSLDCSSTQRQRSITIQNSMFSPSIYGGLVCPFAVGVVVGVDIKVINTVFMGAVTTPASQQYPSITGTALIWQSNNQVSDSTTFSNCKFISSNAGTVWPSAIGGFLGTVQFDDQCTFVNVTNNKGQTGIIFSKTPAAGTTSQFLNDYEEGTFPITISGSTSGSGAVAGVYNYTRIGRQVTINVAMTNVTFPAYVGTLQIGLPFTSRSDTDSSYLGAPAYFFPLANWTTGAAFAGWTPMVGVASNVLALQLQQVNGDRQTMATNANTTTASTAGLYLSFSLTYFV